MLNYLPETIKTRCKPFVNGIRVELARRRLPESWSTLGERVSPEPLRTDSREQLERLININIAPFWHPRVIDLRQGGFHLHHDIVGRDLGPSPKYVITQARMTWFFSRISRSPYASASYLDAAEHGYRGLVEQFRDEAAGGYFWMYDPSSPKARGEAVDQRKMLSAQAFVLYALSEYALASGKDSARQEARDLFSVLLEKCSDKKHGGFIELFERGWTPTDPSVIGYHDAIHSTHKHFQGQVHMLEALTRYLLVDQSEVVKGTVTDLLKTLLTRMFRGPRQVLISTHRNDWSVDNYNHSSYGHELEIIWLMLEAMIQLGKDTHAHRELFESVFCNTVQAGMDLSQGGFYWIGPLRGHPWRFEKFWWVQAEALLTSLYLFLVYGNPEYATCFNRTLTWIVEKQADWKHGEWFEVVNPNGSVSGCKAGKWKAAYHSGRAVLDALELLDKMGKRAAGNAPIAV